MTPRELKSSLAFLKINQAELATLIDMQPLAVSRWISGKIAVPGAVKAYINLLCRLPEDYVAVEVYRGSSKTRSKVRETK